MLAHDRSVQPSNSGSRRAGRGAGGCARGGRAHSGRASGPGRGHVKASTKAARAAAKAKYLAEKYGADGSKLAAAAASSSGAGSSNDVEIVGERTREERDAELRKEAVPLDSDCD